MTAHDEAVILAALRTLQAALEQGRTPPGVLELLIEAEGHPAPSPDDIEALIQRLQA